jgi:hypothetical protein
MNINASIIDLQLVKIQKQIKDRAEDELGINDSSHLKSLAFVYLCVKTVLDLDSDEAFDCLVESCGDFGVDALHITEAIDGEFNVTLFQGKYKQNLEDNSNFEQSGIQALINAVGHIFDPSSELGNINDRLLVKVEQVRSLITDGLIPHVRVIACNNGLKWNSNTQITIDQAGFRQQVIWEHVNHDVLINILQRTKPVDETLRLTGKAVVEDMNFSRVCIGRILVSEVAALMQNHGERLLERNIRKYLGLHSNRVNEVIRDTFMSNEPTNFYFLNNGLTLVCDDFTYNSLQDKDFQVQVKNLQIVSGGQTYTTILKIAQELEKQGKYLPIDASVLVRLYKLPTDNHDIVAKIIQATNSEIPVNLADLHDNDIKQQRLEQNINELGYTYQRKRMGTFPGPKDITISMAAEAVLAVWRQAPHQAKFFTREHFGKLYDTIFSNSLNGAQVIIASLLYCIAEKRSRKPYEQDPLFVRYASCFIAMQMGAMLLTDLNLKLDALDHRNFTKAKDLIDKRGDAYFEAACQDIELGLKSLYREESHETGGISVQQQSATFRRGDLIKRLKKIR